MGWKSWIDKQDATPNHMGTIFNFTKHTNIYTSVKQGKWPKNGRWHHKVKTTCSPKAAYKAQQKQTLKTKTKNLDLTWMVGLTSRMPLNLIHHPVYNFERIWRFLYKILNNSGLHFPIFKLGKPKTWKKVISCPHPFKWFLLQPFYHI